MKAYMKMSWTGGSFFSPVDLRLRVRDYYTRLSIQSKRARDVMITEGGRNRHDTAESRR